MKNKKRWIILAISTILLIMVDQISKGWSQNLIGINEIIPNVLRLQYVENKGGAFGVGQNSTMTFIITNIIVLGIIFRFLILQKDRIDKKTYLCLAMIISGGIGNVIDRILFGYVRDFIEVLPSTHFPIFNFADVLIVIGWLALIGIFSLSTYHEFGKEKLERMKNKDGE